VVVGGSGAGPVDGGAASAAFVAPSAASIAAATIVFNMTVPHLSWCSNLVL
jgi:hypothetical protein